MGNSEYGRKHVIISLILNLIVFILSVMASIMMFTGFKFMHGYEPVLETRKGRRAVPQGHRNCGGARHAA